MLCLVRYLFVISRPTSVIDCLGRFVPEMTCCVSSGTLNLAQLNSAAGLLCCSYWSRFGNFLSLWLKTSPNRMRAGVCRTWDCLSILVCCCDIRWRRVWSRVVDMNCDLLSLTSVNRRRRRPPWSWRRPTDVSHTASRSTSPLSCGTWGWLNDRLKDQQARWIDRDLRDRTPTKSSATMPGGWTRQLLTADYCRVQLTLDDVGWGTAVAEAERSDWTKAPRPTADRCRRRSVQLAASTAMATSCRGESNTDWHWRQRSAARHSCTPCRWDHPWRAEMSD